MNLGRIEFIKALQILFFLLLGTWGIHAQENARPTVIQNFQKNYGAISVENLNRLVDDFYPAMNCTHVAVILDSLRVLQNGKFKEDYIKLLIRLEQKYFKYSCRFMNKELLQEIDSLVGVMNSDSKKKEYFQLLELNKTKNKFNLDHDRYGDISAIDNLIWEDNDSLSYLKNIFQAEVALENEELIKAKQYLLNALGHSARVKLSPREKIEQELVKLRINAPNLDKEEITDDFERLFNASLALGDSCLGMVVQIEVAKIRLNNDELNSIEDMTIASDERLYDCKDLKLNDDLLQVRLEYAKAIHNSSFRDDAFEQWLYIFNALVTLERTGLGVQYNDEIGLFENIKSINDARLDLKKGESKFIKKMLILGASLFLGLGILIFLLLRNRNVKQRGEIEKSKNDEILKEKDRLYASITEEISEPLNNILAPLDHVQGLLTEPKAIRDVKLAKKNGARLKELFTQILDWNSLVTRANKTTMQPVNLKLTVTDISNRFLAMAKSKKLIFKQFIDLPEDLFNTDRDKLDKIFSNIIGNAVKFCDSGQEVNVQAKIQFDFGKQYLALAIKDSGPGISKTDQPNLFVRHFQGEQGKLKGGTGIGLAYVSDLVNLLEGSIRVESAIGEGTTFYVKIPVTPSVADRIAENKKNFSANSSKPLILVVEDEPELLEFIKSILVEDFEVLESDNTSVGLTLAQQHIPDLVITDWSLPDHTGGWLTEKIKSNELTAHLPVMVLTAFSSDENLAAVYKAGAILRMNKPFKASELVQQVNSILAQQERLKQSWLAAIKKDSTETTVSIDPFVAKVKQLVEDQLQDDSFSVEKLAQQLFISRIQLFRRIKTSAGMNPSLLIKTIRLKKAKNLLATSKTTIAEVAYTVGFSDPNYFSTAYRQLFGHSPKKDQK